VKKRRVIKLVISPKNDTISVGQLLQFSVYGRRNTGDSVSIPSRMQPRADISGGGAYTAGQTVGAYRVTANQKQRLARRHGRRDGVFGAATAAAATAATAATAPPPHLRRRRRRRRAPPPPPRRAVASVT